MENEITYKKSNASEIIEVGDVLMIEPETTLVTKAVANEEDEMPINSRLIVGVCSDADNTTPLPIIIDSGSSGSNDIERTVIFGGDSNSVEMKIIDSGDSSNSPREIVTATYYGMCEVNTYGVVSLGDKLCISNIPGKAKAMDYLNNDYFVERPIGKVIKYTNSKSKVEVLLDIE